MATEQANKTPAAAPAHTSYNVTAPSDGDSQRLAGALRHALIRREQERNEAPRERENSFGGLNLKLAVHGSIPGYHLYWENDQDGAIEQLLYSGFDFVTHDELRAQKPNDIVKDMDISSVVSRYVGIKADGSALRAYLMKCPDEVWSNRESGRHRQADDWDNAIRQQAENPGEGMRKLKQGFESKTDTSFRKEYL